MAAKTKIAHIITLLELGGAQQVALHIFKNLDRELYEPILICGRGAYFDKEAERLDRPVFFINSLVRQVHPLLDLFALIELTLVLRREKPQIVHTHSSKAGILGRLAARLAGVPTIVHTFHGFGFNREQRVWTRAVFIFLERCMARLSTALVTVSMANRDWALSLGIGRADQYHLVRAGVQLKLFRSTTRRPNAPQGIHVTMNQKLITTIGPFKPQKNLFDFIEAAALIHKTQPDSRFLIVGDGALRPDLEELIRKKKLTEVIMMPGWRRDIPHIFMRTNVFVMTSLWEGLPCALVEAMASGLPCVANAVDGVTDVIAEGVNGYLTVPKRPEQTADRVIHLLENPLVALEMGQKARESIGLEFDIDQMVRQQEDIYKAVR